VSKYRSGCHGNVCISQVCRCYHSSLVLISVLRVSLFSLAVVVIVVLIYLVNVHPLLFVCSNCENFASG